MTNKKTEIFEKTLTSEYNHAGFVNFIREVITGINLKSYDVKINPYNTFSAFIEGYYQIGEFTESNGNSIGVFSVALKRGESVERARSAQRTFVKTLLENGGYAAALVAFFSTGNEKWRFSFVRMDYEFAKGKIKENLTPARRYSYLVGKGEPCHTAMDRLLPIFLDDNKLPTIDEIEEAFSVEKVTKEFFEAYKEKYLEMKEFLEANKDFERESQIRHFTSEQFTKKLLSQIVFLYFIQKKGWLGVNAVPKVLTEKEYKNAFFSHGNKSRELVGKVYYQDGEVFKLNTSVLQSLSSEDETVFSTCVKGQPWGTGPKNFMRMIFNDCTKRDKNFFDDYLEPLFYTGLNLDRGENAFFPPLHCRIPFLNGGLFEELDHYDWRYNDFAIPNEMFSNANEKGRLADGILDIFDRYNFTMAEDEPLEKEVAVDPEMLGKVFENLLDVKDRKSTGSFYTPRDIVHYMCQESLINYLVSKSGVQEDDIRKFITLGEFFKEEDAKRTKKGEDGKYKFDYGKELEMPSSILDYKNNVNRIEELDKYLAEIKCVDPAVGSGAFPLGLLNEIVKARQTLSTYMAIGMNGFQRRILYAQRSPYQLKTQTIKNCIFACDLEPSATDITKLRLWLALVIEDEISEDNNNSIESNEMLGQHTKPRKLPNLDCNVLCGNSLIDSFEGVKLICNTEALGNAVEGSQISIADRLIQGHIDSLVDLQNSLYNVRTTEEKEDIKKQIQVLYDAIIVEQLSSREDLVKKYASNEIRNANSKPFIIWQLYYPEVFRDNGGFDICIGNPPYFLYQANHKNEIEILRKTDGLESAFGGKLNAYKLFLAKALHSIVRKNGLVCYIFQNSFMADKQAALLRKEVLENHQIIKIDSFPERDSVRKRVFESVKMSVCIAIIKKSNSNKPFEINVWADKNKTDGLHTIFTKNDIMTIDPETYSIPRLRQEYLPLIVKINNIKKAYHMKCYEGELNMTNHKPYFTSDKNNPKVLKGASIQRYYWTENMSQGIIEYLDEKKYIKDFSRSAKAQHHNNIRIAMQGMTGANDKTRIVSTIVPAGLYLANSCNYVLPDNMDIYYLLGVFNSTLVNWYFKCFSTNSNVNGYEVDGIPIPNDDKESQDDISTLVRKILNEKQIDNNADTSDLEKQIDQLVYKIYQLGADEIKIIEN